MVIYNYINHQRLKKNPNTFQKKLYLEFCEFVFVLVTMAT